MLETPQSGYGNSVYTASITLDRNGIYATFRTH